MHIIKSKVVISLTESILGSYNNLESFLWQALNEVQKE